MAVDVSELLPFVGVPTLVMNQLGDRASSLENARELAARIPGARFVALPGNLHIAEFGDTGAAVRAIQDFLVSAEGWPADSGDSDDAAAYARLA